MATETIRSFLVELGYKQDESALKKFEDGIAKATKAVFALASAVTATATIVAAGIAKFASNLETLYFAAQRTGSSATQLKALDLATRNLGANAGEAQQSVEALASALRLNPGNVGLLTGLLGKLGYQLKVNADGSVNSADALIKLSHVFKTMPFYQAAQFAQMLGISEKTLYQLTRGNLMEEYTKALKELGPGGFDKASAHAHQFMVDLRDFQAQLEVFGVQMADAIQQKLGISLKWLRAWFEKNGPWLAQRVANVTNQMIDAAQWIAAKVVVVIGKLKEWDKETDGLSTKLIALAVLLKVTGAGSIIGGVLSLAAAFTRLGVAVAPVAASMAALYAIWKVFHAATHDQNLSAGEVPTIVRFKEWVNNHLPDYAKTPEGLLLNNPGNLEFRNQPGAAKVGRWAAFPSINDGLFALGRQLELYSGRGLNTVRSIISRYAPVGDGNNTGAYISDVMKRTGFGADQALNLKDPNVLAAMMNAITWHEQGRNPYDPGLVKAQAQRAVVATINPQTTIHVNGAGDPAQVASRVADQQRQVNADLARNFLPALQ